MFKSAVITMVLFQTLSLHSLAQQVCTDEHQYFNGTRCATTGAGAATAAGSAIFAAKKYSEAESIAKNNTRRLFLHQATTSGENLNHVTRSTSEIVNGDRITMTYNLSEVENRQYHIDLKTNEAADARSHAATYASQAMTATRSESVFVGVDNKGKAVYITQNVPDLQARARYATMAAEQLIQASKYEAEAAAARNGGPVPSYTLSKVVESRADTARVTAEFVQERIARGGRILTVERLPVEHFNRVKSLVGAGRAGLVGIAAGAVFALEEIAVGAIAGRLSGNNDYRPQMQGFGAR